MGDRAITPVAMIPFNSSRLFILFNPLAIDTYTGRIVATNHANWVFGPFFRAVNGYLVFPIESPDVKDYSRSRDFGACRFIHGFFDDFIWDSDVHTGILSLSFQGSSVGDFQFLSGLVLD